MRSLENHRFSVNDSFRARSERMLRILTFV
jgi:hypothetical protein